MVIKVNGIEYKGIDIEGGPHSKEYIKQHILSRGFTEEENKEYGQVFGYCANILTDNDIEYQNRLSNLIKSILDNDHLDYISKIEKIYILLQANKSLKEYSKWMFNK